MATIAPSIDTTETAYRKQLSTNAAFLYMHGPQLANLKHAYREYLGQPLTPPTQKAVSEVLLFAPVYLNDICPNECVYCGFRKSNNFKRTQLSLDESVAQAKLLAEQGHATIDLVTGEIPTDAFVDRVATTVRRILSETAVRKVNLNLGALTEAHYQKLTAAGAYGYHIYQETYDTETYFKMHVEGHKRNMPYRLDAPERALAAGFKAIGLAALLGLGPWESDIPKLLLHARYLKEKFPNAKLGFSLPRIQSFEADGNFVVPHPMDDAIYMKTVCFVRQAFPDASITVTTREPAAIRDQLLAFGVVNKISAGVSTKPGGYGHQHDEALDQFNIADHRSLDQVKLAVQTAGLQAVTH